MGREEGVPGGGELLQLRVAGGPDGPARCHRTSERVGGGYPPLDQELQEVIEERTSVWGITVMSVEIRDIVIPQELQEAMSAEAQAEREKNARMVLAEVEKDISSMLVDAANVYDENELAVRLRTMHLLYESVKNSGGTVVIPSAYSEGFADAGLDRAPDSLKSGK